MTKKQQKQRLSWESPVRRRQHVRRCTPDLGALNPDRRATFCLQNRNSLFWVFSIQTLVHGKVETPADTPDAC